MLHKEAGQQGQRIHKVCVEMVLPAGRGVVESRVAKNWCKQQEKGQQTINAGRLVSKPKQNQIPADPLLWKYGSGYILSWMLLLKASSVP